MKTKSANSVQRPQLECNNLTVVVERLLCGLEQSDNSQTSGAVVYRCLILQNALHEVIQLDLVRLVLNQTRAEHC